VTCFYCEAILRVVERDRLELSLKKCRFFCLIDLVLKLFSKGIWSFARPGSECLR
jgi:hypothetical protein